MFNMLYRIAAAPLFPKLRRFPHGRRFKQWTGDDSKALMKVYMFIKYAGQVITYYHHRFTSQQYLDMFLMAWLQQFRLS